MMHVKIDIGVSMWKNGTRSVKVRAVNIPADSGNNRAIYNHVSTEYVKEGIHRLRMYEE